MRNRKYLWILLVLIIGLIAIGCYKEIPVKIPVAIELHYMYQPTIIINDPLPQPSPTLPIPTTTPVPLLVKTSGISWPKEDAYPRANDLVQINARVSLDWDYSVSKTQALQAVGITYLPMQWSCNVNVANIKAFASQFPGMTWLAFNEPDNANQANCTPKQAAQAYLSLRQAIMDVDPSARIFCCGTAFYPAHVDFMAQWAQIYRDLYGNWPTIDGIHLHSYGHFEDRLDAPRRKYELEQVHTWAQQQSWAANKPFIISEWAVTTASWWGDQDRGPIANYYIPTMRAWFDQQAWIIADIWFSSWCSDGYYEPDNIWQQNSSTLTSTGIAWRTATP